MVKEAREEKCLMYENRKKTQNVRVLAINFWSPEKCWKRSFFFTKHEIEKHVAEAEKIYEARQGKKFSVADSAYELPASVDLNLFVMLEKAICNLIKFPLNFLRVETKNFRLTHRKSRRTSKKESFCRWLLSVNEKLVLTRTLIFTSLNQLP